MQFIANGPDIPDELLQAHEEGRVVFFCGAGISYPAGLPGFKGLVDQIYDSIGTTLTDIEREASKHSQFDATLDLLERRLPGQRRDVRRALAKALKTKAQRKGATDTHTALLQLARSRNGALRLVTTNFDRLFHIAAKRAGQPFQDYTAPMLPIPKNSRWDGVVYLHGLLPNNPNDTDLNRLVVTSGDFGLAYLTERWAARFVSELFRNYMVCFVGYSINDPILRYMMDALAADRMLGEITPQAWALGDCERGEEHRTAIRWEAKGVKPILYGVPDKNDHSMLHKTIQAWAKVYREGVIGKEQLVVKHAFTEPSMSTQQDDFVGRMLWALSDPSGLPAERFANFDPAPSLNWLFDAFSDKRFHLRDLARFGVTPRDEEDDDLRFSVIHRPASYDRSPHMFLVSDGIASSQWDNVMRHLASWLVRHLNDPRLVIWVAQHGGQIHDHWRTMIEAKLNYVAGLEGADKIAELEAIRLQAPNAIPSGSMRTLWSLILTGRVKSSYENTGLYGWGKSFEQNGLTAALRLKLRELLSPQVSLKEPFPHSEERENNGKTMRMNQLVKWELVLAADNARLSIQYFNTNQWQSALPHLLEDFQQLLRDALDLARELGGADDLSDPSHWSMPSIAPHGQNQEFYDWVILIELLRDAWLGVRNSENEPVRATLIALTWFELPYPTFKRLALFAASQDKSITPEQWVNWLLVNNSWWLWSSKTLREVCRLLVLQGSQLTGKTQADLETAILAGPPDKLFVGDLTSDCLNKLADKYVWRLLAKLKTTGLKLGAVTQARLNDLSETYPQWQLADNESVWFSHDDLESQVVNTTPRKRSMLVGWLTKPVSEWQPGYEDKWRDVCRTRFFHSLFALCDLAKENKWPIRRWSDALLVWSQKGLVLRSWRYAAPVVQRLPDDIIQNLIHSVTCWMEAVSKSINQPHKDILLDLCRRFLELSLQTETGTCFNRSGVKSVPTDSDAVNHSIMRVTQVLINLWFNQKPNDNDKLPSDIEPFFKKICDVQVDRFRHGRVLLGTILIALFRVDPKWAEQFILPLLDWDNSEEAKAIWKGFLRSPRLYQPLMVAFKPHFLKSASHYADLGEFGRQYASFLTYAAVERVEGYSVEEFRSAFDVLPQEGLEESLRRLTLFLEGAAEQRKEYWRSRVLPFWKNVWPKFLNHATPCIIERLSLLIIAAGSEFPSALAEMRTWLRPLEHNHYIAHFLHKSGLCTSFPEEALSLLHIVINRQRTLATRDLRLCLTEIVNKSANLKQDDRLQRLCQYCRECSM